MKNYYNFNISTNDDNRFYLNGLFSILSNNFQLESNIQLGDKTINLKFISTAKSDTCKSLLSLITTESKFIYFFIIDNNDSSVLKSKTCCEKLNIIYRDDSVNSVILKIKDGILNFLSRSSDIYDKYCLSSCIACSNVRLTYSEYQVLNLIQKENTITEISYILNKSAKTIHGQKKNAMRKLGVKSNHALYELLRHKRNTPYLISQIR